MKKVNKMPTEGRFIMMWEESNEITAIAFDCRDDGIYSDQSQPLHISEFSNVINSSVFYIADLDYKFLSRIKLLESLRK